MDAVRRKPLTSASTAAATTRNRFGLGYLVWVLLPVCLAVFLYHLDPFDPVAFPDHELTRPQDAITQSSLPQPPQWVNDRILLGAEFVGSGQLSGPEDVVYSPKQRVIYTGCADGWIMRVRVVNESAPPESTVVERWANTGGRPLGLALSPHNHNQLIVADAFKGLLRITKEDEQEEEEAVVEVLTDEAEGRKFRLTDGVDVAEDGIIYFTDASYKYSMYEYIYDSLEGRPYGRLLSYDPASGETKVLMRDLYFANGVALSPDQTSLVFCETSMRRCSRYRIKCGERNSGTVDTFIVDLPGFPDNVHYDGEGHYWIGITSAFPPFFYKALQSRLVRKVYAIIEKYIGLRHLLTGNGGTFAVDLLGKPVAHLYDPNLAITTSAIKVGDHLYCGSLNYQHIIRISLPPRLQLQ